MPLPDYEALSTCPGGPFPCGPVASPTCVAEPGTTLVTPTGTFTHPVKLSISGTTARYTICPGIYYGGFGTLGDSRNPIVTMLPGTYVMIGGGFTVGGTASITSVSSQGDGVSIYNSGGDEAFSENFPYLGSARATGSRSSTSTTPTTRRARTTRAGAARWHLARQLAHGTHPGRRAAVIAPAGEPAPGRRPATGRAGGSCPITWCNSGEG